MLLYVSGRNSAMMSAIERSANKTAALDEAYRVCETFNHSSCLRYEASDEDEDDSRI